MVEQMKYSLVKPGPETPFHIDFDWWKQHDGNWRIFLHSCLCPIHQETFSDTTEISYIDWIDAETAEVTSIDGLQFILINHCAKQPEFITINTTLVDAAFRTLLSNGNIPMTINEIARVTNRPAVTILRTLSGGQVYKGLRPCH